MLSSHLIIYETQKSNMWPFCVKGDGKFYDWSKFDQKVKVDQKVKSLTKGVNNMTVWSFDKQYGKILWKTVFTEEIASINFRTTI